MLVLETQLQILSDRRECAIESRQLVAIAAANAVVWMASLCSQSEKQFFPPANTMSCSTWPGNYLSQGLKAADAFACKLRNLQPCGS